MGDGDGGRKRGNERGKDRTECGIEKEVTEWGMEKEREERKE